VARKDFRTNQLNCSFCGKGQKEVRKLIAGPTVYICDECIRLCTDIIDEETEKELLEQEPQSLPTPEDMVSFLDNYVIGQATAKKVVSVAVYNHYKRIRHLLENGEDEIEISKSNVLLAGPTGTGKTLLAQSLARLLNVPFTIADATTLTEAGYVGEDVENILSALLAASDGDVEKAQQGIIYIDEIDKIARRGDSPSMTRDVSGEGVQQALLKIIEGTMANVAPRGSRKYGQNEMLQIDTSQILVICGGSFTGIEQIIQRRTGKRGLGFGADLTRAEKKKMGEILKDIAPEDMTKYGLIPEFVGRLPIIATFDDLEQKDLEKILTEPKNALIKQYQKLFSLEQVDLSFDRAAIRSVAEEAMENRSGARGLRGILETAMLDIMYEVPFKENIKKCRITADVIKNKKSPKLTYQAKKSA